MSFRRSLDAQGSADLIPTAGPDAAADQGPAIKAVWEPSGPGRPGDRPAGRRAALESRSSRRSGSRQKGKAKRRGVIFGSAAAVVIIGAVVADLNTGGSGPQKGAATKVLPMVSGSATPSTALAGALNETALPSASASQSASASASASPSASPTPSPSAPSSPSGHSASASPSATRTTPRSNPTTCFLIFCG